MKSPIPIDSVGDVFTVDYFGGEYGVTFQASDVSDTVRNFWISGVALQRLTEVHVDLLQGLVDHVLGKDGAAGFTVRITEGEQ